MPETHKERKKEYMKNHHKRKDLLNYLINRVEELENICLNGYISKYYKSFLNSGKYKKRCKK